MIDPILITGCARSGTSLTAGIIEACGAFGGRTSGPNANNRKGMFENPKVRNDLVKPYLTAIGVDPMGQNPLPDPAHIPIPVNWADRVRGIFEADGYEDGPWYYKGAKMCLIWPVWHDAFPEAKWVIVRRSDEDIIKSCLRTGFMRAYQNAKGWQGWIDVHKRRFAEMQVELQVKEFWPGDIFERNDLESIQGIVEWLGLQWNEDKVRAFIDPKLWKGKK